MAHPTMSEIAEKLEEYKDNIKGDGGPVSVDPHTLVWAEYWLRYAMKHNSEK